MIDDTAMTTCKTPKQIYPRPFRLSAPPIGLSSLWPDAGCMFPSQRRLRRLLQLRALPDDPSARKKNTRKVRCDRMAVAQPLCLPVGQGGR